MPVRAFLFDFDGLIIDTETASRAGWEWLYRQHGHELPPEKWALMVGTVDGWDIGAISKTSSAGRSTGRRGTSSASP